MQRFVTLFFWSVIGSVALLGSLGIAFSLAQQLSHGKPPLRGHRYDLVRPFLGDAPVVALLLEGSPLELSRRQLGAQFALTPSAIRPFQRARDKRLVLLFLQGAPVICDLPTKAARKRVLGALETAAASRGRRLSTSIFGSHLLVARIR